MPGSGPTRRAAQAARPTSMRTLFACLVLGASVPVAAHDPGLSSLCVEIVGHRATATLTCSGADFVQSFGRVFDRNGDAKIMADELNVDAMRELAPAWVQTTVGDQALVWTTIDAWVEVDGDVVTRLSAVDCPSGAVEVHVPALAFLPRGHRQFATLMRNHRPIGEALLSAQVPRVSWTAEQLASRPDAPAAVAGSNGGVGSYIALGIEHVLTGYDHILFLLALLLSVASLTQALAIVTAFTVSHSLTLALAVLDVAHLPSTLVECAIAASVAFVAAENLLRARPKARAGWTFAFGLLHGFGFASCLSDVGIGTGLAAVRPLFGFNLGVELGQLGLVVLVLPLLLLLRRRSARYAGRVSLAVSSGVLFCGVIWLLQRLP